MQRRRNLAARSALALAAGFPLAIASVVVASLVFEAAGLTPQEFSPRDHELAQLISEPDFVAFCAGIAGMLSLTTAKSAALIGVFVSITAIPAGANAGVAAVYGDWSSFRGSLGQLAANLSAILLAGTLTLAVQRAVYVRRRRRRHRLELGEAGARTPAD